jgi:hypothetical protein
MSGRAVFLWVLIPFVSLCALAFWLTRETPPAPVTSPRVTRIEQIPAPVAPSPPAATPPVSAPSLPLRPSGRTFGEGSTLPSRAAPPAPITIPEAEPLLEPAQAPVDKEDIRRAIQTVVPLMRQCFQDIAEHYPGPQAVTLKFTLDGQGLTGQFRDGEVAGTTIQDPLALACFLDSLLDVRFPPPRGGGRVTITYPFRFLPGADAGR